MTINTMITGESTKFSACSLPLSIVLMYLSPNPNAKHRKERGETSSRQLNGLPATWAANSFKTFWLQSFSMVQARTQANSIDIWV